MQRWIPSFCQIMMMRGETKKKKPKRVEGASVATDVGSSAISSIDGSTKASHPSTVGPSTVDSYSTTTSSVASSVASSMGEDSSASQQ